MCPFNTGVCGSTDTYTMSNIGETLNITFTLTRGETCFYRIKHSCGLTKVDFNRVDNSDNIVIEYIEFEKGQLL